MPRASILILGGVLLGCLGWLTFATGDSPPDFFWIWGAGDGTHPSADHHITNPYEMPGGAAVKNFDVKAHHPEDGGQLGVALRHQPNARDKVLMAVGIEPSATKRWVVYESTGQSRGTFWKFRRKGR